VPCLAIGGDIKQLSIQQSIHFDVAHPTSDIQQFDFPKDCAGHQMVLQRIKSMTRGHSENLGLVLDVILPVMAAHDLCNACHASSSDMPTSKSRRRFFMGNPTK
jgi:hypothetical protein